MLAPLPSVTVPRPRSENQALPVSAELAPFTELAATTEGRVLVWDIENRPSTYWYEGRTTAEITAIAWAFADEPDSVEVRTLEPPPHHETSMRQMLTDFSAAYAEARVVTGHYIRKHDLGIVVAHLVEFGLPVLGAKLVSDTRLELIRWKDMPASQESLGDTLHLDAPKESMSQAKWREANRLTPQGIAETRRRVIGDVRQHLELRAALLERGLLRAPRMWRP